MSDYERQRLLRGQQGLPDFWPFGNMADWQAHNALQEKSYAYHNEAHAIWTAAHDRLVRK